MVPLSRLPILSQKTSFSNVYFGSSRIPHCSQRITRELDLNPKLVWTPEFVSALEIQWCRRGEVEGKTRIILLIIIGSLATDTGRGGGFGYLALTHPGCRHLPLVGRRDGVVSMFLRPSFVLCLARYGSPYHPILAVLVSSTTSPPNSRFLFS